VLPLDHLVLATPDLAATVRWFDDTAGVTPTPGGQHVGFGTRNELVALGIDSYLEIVGPDPEQPDPEGPRPFGIDGLTTARLVTWAVKATDLSGHIERCASAGVDLGVAIDMSRAKPDGSLLEWSLTIPSTADAVRLIPFLIDWRGAPSPARTSAAGATLEGLHAIHPEADSMNQSLETLGVDLQVQLDNPAQLFATLSTPNGLVELS